MHAEQLGIFFGQVMGSIHLAELDEKINHATNHRDRSSIGNLLDYIYLGEKNGLSTRIEPTFFFLMKCILSLIRSVTCCNLITMIFHMTNVLNELYKMNDSNYGIEPP